jgi:hypothetical protein
LSTQQVNAEKEKETVRLMGQPTQA